MVIETLDKDSQENINDLITRIRDKECCPFIGAGLSMRANYPSWAKLISKLKTAVIAETKEEFDDESLDYKDRAENYKARLGIEKYRDILINEFDPNKDKQPWLLIHEKLIEMPFLSYITTNFDCILENVFSDKGLLRYYSYYPTLPISHIRDQHIYHIHGVVDHANLETTQDSVILTRSDFNEAYAPGSNLIKLITCAYTELTLLFIGFTITDQFMLRILESSKYEFEQTKNIAFNRGVGPLKIIKHFAMLPIPKVNEEDLQNPKRDIAEIIRSKIAADERILGPLGVKIIWYRGDEYNHTELINIIREMNFSLNGVQTNPIAQDLTFREHER